VAEPKKPGGLMIAVMHGAPPPVRGLHEPPPHEEPDMDDRGGAPDQDQDDSQQIQPEWVHFGTEAENCKYCTYMNGNDCEVLRMPVGPEDHCSAFAPKDQGAMPPEAGPPMGNGQ
jgi:hypothetical protein